MLEGLALACALAPARPPDVQFVKSWEIPGTSTFDFLGSAVEFLGDVDGDGVADLLACVTENKKDPEPHAHGAVRCLSGSDGRMIFALGSAEANIRVGSDLVRLDDMDGDGVPEFAVENWDEIEVRSGRDGQFLRSLVPCEPKPGRFWSMEVAPDMDGDGRRDVLAAIGDEFNDSDVGRDSGPGRLLVLSTRDGSTVRAIEAADVRKSRFGLRGAVLADRNGDQTPELAIDFPGDGSYRIYSGATGKLQSTMRRSNRVLFGPLVDLGDVDGDGKADVVVGARSVDQSWVGLELVSGRDGSCLASQSLDSGYGFGCMPIALVADLNGDGFRDLMVGEPDHADYTGRVRALSGRRLEVLGSITGPATNSHFGGALGVIDDLGDSRGPAIVIGAEGDDRAAEQGGCVSLWRLGKH